MVSVTIHLPRGAQVLIAQAGEKGVAVKPGAGTSWRERRCRKATRGQKGVPVCVILQALTLYVKRMPLVKISFCPFLNHSREAPLSSLARVSTHSCCFATYSYRTQKVKASPGLKKHNSGQST